MTLHADGTLHMTRITCYFLPKPTEQVTGSQYLYNPDDGGQLDAVIKKASGQTVCTFGVYAMPSDRVAWRMDTFRNKADSSLTYKFQEAGDYVLEFQLAGKVFQSVPFSVRELGSDDPYSTGSHWVLEGDWQKYGYIHIPNNSPSSTVAFKFWHRSIPPKNIFGTGEILGPDGQVVAHSPKAEYRLNKLLARTQMNFRTANGSSFTGQQLTSKPGNYTLRTTMDGVVRNYPFQVAGGKIVRQGRQSFSAPPAERLEGGKDSWWLQSQ